MKRLIVIFFAIVCGVAFSDGFAKKPTKQNLSDDEIRIKLDSLRKERDKIDSLKEALGSRGWDRPAKFTDYYCLGDYLSGDEFSRNKKNEYLKLEEESVKFRFKLYELCPNYCEDKDIKDYIIAYAMHEKEKDSLVCQPKVIHETANIVHEIILHRLSPLYTIGLIYLKPTIAEEEISCDKLWKVKLIDLQKFPSELAEKLHTRQFAEQIYSLIENNSLVCDTMVKVEDEYRCYAVRRTSIRPIYEWMETFVNEEADESWKTVFNDLLLNPTNDSRVVISRIHYAL